MKVSDLNIMVIPSWYPPSGGEFFREHSIAIAGQGPGVTVLAAPEAGIREKPGLYLSGGFGTRHTEKNGISEFSRTFRRIPLTVRPNVRLWIKHVLSMFGEIYKSGRRPDIIQAHSSMWAGVAVARIKQLYGIPFVLTEHRGRFTGRVPGSGLIKPWHIPLLREAFEGADSIVTVSRALQNRILEICPHVQKKLCVIPNMTDTDHFIPSAGSLPVKDTFDFICVTSLEKIKGAGHLIRAFSLLKKEEKAKGAKLTIVGSGPLEKYLGNLTKKLGLEDSVTFTGYLGKDKILQQLQRADAFVMPSLCEAFGIVIIEAMSCGLPVVATESGGPAEIVNKQCGITVKAGNDKELAHAMLSMMLKANSYDKQEIALHTRQNYGRDIVAGQYIELYKQILNKGKDG